ncbi:MAG: class I SAM-dependent methyltransferase [Rhodospirillales bacterium]
MSSDLKQRQYAGMIAGYRPLQEHWNGPYASHKWRDDPRYITFILSRYKHAAKILRGKKTVVDIGCGDAFGFPILLQEIDRVHGIDIEKVVLDDIRARDVLPPDRATFALHNIVTDGPLEQKFDAAVSFDLLSSIPRSDEEAFITNICRSLDEDAIFVLGAQNGISTQYSLAQSHMDQDNFKDYDEMVAYMRPHFHNVVIIGMNDETIHTGRETMTQYFLALGFGPRT